MRWTALLAASMLALLTGCGGDESSEADDDPTTTDAPATTDATSAPATSIESPTPSLECEDEPDPADYVPGRIPPANRPCEIPDELVVHEIRDGVGDEAADGDTVIVDYIGIRAEDGIIFDESYSRGVPLDFPLGRGGVIQGWDDGLVGAQAGSLLKLDIPADLAYGDSPPGGGDGDIEPGDALTFIVEVRAIVPSVTAADAPLDLQIDPSIGATEVTTTVIEQGEGGSVELGDTAVVHLLLVRGDNQVVLFNTWERMDPLQIIMEEGQTLPGIFEGLQGSQVGSLLAIAMPPDDAFGPDGEASLGLPADVDLIAIAEVVGVY
ncbi:MAG: hypothetical protein HKN41_07280 [Ilumatobacter sp.]|nr:hypothetical protein [Ilumatobacter sp.]